jgi:3-oxoacyl-[acyl-carrier-protein] synthase-3
MALVLGASGPVRVRGAGTAFPRRRLTNEEVLVVTAPRLWPGREAPSGERLAFLARGLEESLGVRERAWAHVPGEPFAHGEEETTIDLAAAAAAEALADARLDASELGLVLVSTSTPPRMTSTLSSAVGARLGATRAACMDLRTGCAAGLFALATAALYLGAGAGPVLLVGTETFSKVIPPAYKPAVVALGDGAGALVLDAEGAGRLVASYLATDGTLGKLVNTPGELPPTHEAIDRGDYLLGGDAEELAAALPGKYLDAIAGVLARAALGAGAIDRYVPHQTSVPLIRAVAARVGVPEERTYVNVASHANVGAAGWLVALAEARRGGLVPAGSRVLLAAVGGGMSWAGAILET